MIRRASIAVFLMLAIVAGCTEKGTQAGAIAPEFSMQDMQGKTVRLADYKGKVIMLEFWATWCPPCREAIPGIEKLHKAYKDKGLVVLAISMDSGGWDGVKSFITDYRMTYPVLKGTEDVATTYQVRSIPMTLIINKDGRIVKRYIGIGSDGDIEKAIIAIL